MELNSLQIEVLKKGSMNSDSADGICHVKALPYLSVVESIVGSYDIKLGGGEFSSTGDGGFFIAPKDIQQTIIHRENREKGIFSARWVFIKATVNLHYSFDSLFDFPVIIPDEYKKRMHEIFDKLFENNDIFADNIHCTEILKILYEISKEKSSTLPSCVEYSLSFIKSHYKEKLSAKDISSAANLSQSYFFSAFKKTMGVSPIAYLNSYRLSLAAEKLINTNKSVSEIADSVGIDDPVYFNKLFKKTYQLSPTKYREIHKTKT
ncbi:MAG: helix-turn-helix transcriptional regulator [Ruminococcaceae bacterium]|nr:helix-turn-helix transcriptional regulator [Oscillospiraceae bacterium]